MTWLLLWLACADPQEAPTEPAPVEAPAPVPEPPPEPPPPAFRATIEPIPADQRARMTGVSWREGCPVTLDELRVVRLTHWTFDGRVAEGELIVAASVAEDVRDAFAAAFDERFPLERVEPVDVYGGDDARSMAANNTSAFNCRPTTGGGGWSQHAYGTAVDVNPVQNPFVRGDRVDPPAGRAWLDRSDVRPGMLTADSALVVSLKAKGWGWGGSWGKTKDYQHLSRSGR